MSDALKRQAAQAAVAEVRDGMILGLGSGSTSEIALALLGERVAAGLKVAGIPTSARTAELSKGYGIPLTSFAEHSRIDLTLDGADEVERGTLHLIKGGGAALLREKIVAAASDRMIVMVDDSKLSDRLGTRWPIPVEIVPFGHEATLARLSAIAPTALRLKDGRPVTTDNGNLIAYCECGPMDNPAEMEKALDAVVGVVESGLFIDIAWRVIVAGQGGIEILERGAAAPNQRRNEP